MSYPPFPRRYQRHSHGFTLAELAVVLVIVAMLLGGMMSTLSAQYDFQHERDTRATLNNVQDALLGYAAAKGRLPCPASPGTTGVENPDGGGTCATHYLGFVPGTTLAIGPTDSSGYVLDAWGNRIRYAVSKGNPVNYAFTSDSGLRSNWFANPTADLYICSTSSGITGTNCGTAIALANDAVAVLISYGKNQQAAPQHSDESANTDDNQTFVSATYVQPNLPTHNGSDDIVTWLSPNILYSRMIAAGKLP